MPAKLLWDHSRTVGAGSQQLVLVPLAGDEALFAHNEYAGPRYLIIAKKATNTLTGKIVEVLLRRTTQPVDTLALFTSLYRTYQSSHLAAPTQGEGYVFLYSADYKYLTGQHFKQGQYHPGAARLAFQPRSSSSSVSSIKPTSIGGGATANIAPPTGNSCIDWYDAETGKYITTTGDCSYGGGGNVPPVYTGGGPSGGGSSGPGGYGGGSGGSTGTTSPQKVDSQLPPCANTVLTNLLASAAQSGASKNLLDAILTALQMPNSKLSVHFVTDNTLADNVSGNCIYNAQYSNYTGINDFTVRLNSSYLAGGIHGSATDLFIAQTILHETLHAALMDWALTHGSSVNGVSFDDLLANFMAMQGLTPNDGQGQHDAMSLLVGQLGSSLYNYYSSIYHSKSLGASNWQSTSLQDCTDLCWTGLENTIGYQWAVAHDPTFKLRCDAIHGAELTGQFSATGSQADNTLQQRHPAGIDPCI